MKEADRSVIIKVNKCHQKENLQGGGDLNRCPGLYLAFGNSKHSKLWKNCSRLQKIDLESEQLTSLLRCNGNGYPLVFWPDAQETRAT